MSDKLPETKSEPAESKGTVIKETYTYYPDGTLKTKKDKNGNLTEYTYDGAGNLLTEKSGSMFISHTYDFAGNELTTTDQTGTTTYTYDELGRVVTKTVPVIGTITYDYDIAQGVEKGCCQVTTTDPKGNVTNKIYDKAGRLESVITRESKAVYTYYDNGSRKSVTYNDGSMELYSME